ncbi:hypothetical protein ABDK00_012340 [Niabella insulamsoli]|uniref:hypothetical protein n=1 Tax=Niabella insulamsoli TaxID=3144874 RepID=UPI0031FE3BA4
MKKVLTVIAFIILAAQIYAQTVFFTYQDTARYLMNEIEAKSNLYIGKPFSVLYDSLKLNPVTAGNGLPQKDIFGKRVFFEFNYEREFEKAHYLIVDFENVPPYNVLFPIFYPSQGQFGPLQSIVDTYKPLIVKDVVTKDYYAEPDWEPAINEFTPVEYNATIAAQQQTLNTNASNYIGQPFSTLWNALQVKPITIHGKAAVGDSEKEGSTAFFYSPPDNLSVTYFVVTWQSPIPKTITQQYQLSTVRNFTNPAEYAIYADKIINHVKTYPLPPGKWIVVSCEHKKVLIDGLHQWRYVVTKKFCDNGNLGTEEEVIYSETSVPVESCAIELVE